MGRHTDHINKEVKGLQLPNKSITDEIMEIQT